MKTTVNVHEFRESFSIRPDSFSYNGLAALFEYLEELEDGTGEELELDPIAICCDFAEYESLEDFCEDYGREFESIEDLSEETTVILVGPNRNGHDPLSCGLIVQGF